MKNTGWINKLKKLDIEIHARSIFLQGLLLMPRIKIPNKFSKWNNLWDKWHNWHKKNGQFSQLQSCIGFVESISEIDRIVVGVQSLKEIQEIISIQHKSDKIKFPEISCNDEDLLYPFNW